MSFNFARRLGTRKQEKTKYRPDQSNLKWQEYEVWREGVEVLQGDHDTLPDASVLQNVGLSAADTLTIILGEPGAGKTKLLSSWFQSAALVALEKPSLGMLLPVFVHSQVLLKCYQEATAATLAGRLWRASQFEWAGVKADSPDRQDLITELFKKNGRLFKPLWLLDGIDELPSTVTAQAQFYKYVVALPGLKVLSCRTAVFQALRRHAAAYIGSEYEILGLTAYEQLEFLRQAVEGAGKESGPRKSVPAQELFQQIQTNAAVRLLAGNPLMLSLIALLASSPNGVRLAQSRFSFYKEAIEELWNSKVTRDDDEYDFAAERDQFLTAKAAEMGLMQLRASFDARGPLARGLRKSGIVRVNDTARTFEFFHLTFQEYYLAKSLAGRDLRQVIEEHWNEPRFEETLALLISDLSGDPARMTEVEVALGWLVEWGRMKSQTAPQTLWAAAHSPLRTVLHLLNRAGGQLDTPPYLAVVDAVACELAVSADRLFSVALDPSTPPILLDWLAGAEDPDVRWAVVQHFGVPAGAVELLAHDKVVDVRSAVASRYDTSPEILTEMSMDESAEVRTLVASNENTPPEALERLAADPNPEIRRAVATHSRTPIHALESLTDCKDERGFEIVRGSIISRIKSTIRTDIQGGVSPFTFQGTEEPSDSFSEMAALLNAKGCVNLKRMIASDYDAPVYLLKNLATDQDTNVRLEIARNAISSSDTLAALASDADKVVRSAVASNRGISPQVLATLAHDPDNEVRRAVASNKESPPQVLAVLAYDADKEVRGAVARNGATSPEALVELTRGEDGYVRSLAARNENLPVESLVELCADSDQYVRAEALRNPKTPGHLLTALVGSRDHCVSPPVCLNKSISPETSRRSGRDRLNVAYNTNAPPDALSGLAADSDWYTRQAVAKNENTPEDVLLRLMADQHPEVRAAAAFALRRNLSKQFSKSQAADEKTPEAIYLQLKAIPLQRENRVAAALALGRRIARHFSNLDGAMLVAADSKEYLYAFEWNDRIPREIATALAGSNNVEVRRRIARYGDLSTEYFAKLARDQDYRVRSDLADNVDVPDKVLMELASNEQEEQYVRISAMIRCDPSSKWFEALVNSPDVRVRSRVAERSRSPAVLAQLAADECPEVRWVIAHNFEAQPETLSKLALDEDKDVRKQVAENSRTPIDVLAKLAFDEDEEVRKVVGERTTTPRSALIELSRDESPEVRRAVAGNAMTPAEGLASLAKSNDLEVRTLVAIHANTLLESL